MILTSVVDAISSRRVMNVDALGHWLAALNRFLRPADGWLVVVLLAFNLMVVVWSVEKADWAPTPSLVHLILLAMLTGLVISKLPLWSALALPVGIAIGFLIIVWRLMSFQADNLHLINTADLWQRLGRWFEAAFSGSINLDTVPFAFGIMSLTWLAGYLAAWVLFRHRNFWGVFVLGGAGLLSNLTYLPAEASTDLLLYLFTALLLVARVHSVRRSLEWQQRKVQYDGHLWLLSLSDSMLLAVAVLILVYFLPVHGSIGPANKAYELMRTPLVSFEDDFNRLFAGLPARKPLPYRIWDDVMAFQGTIHPTTTPVLQVDSKSPMYWKARSYGTYTAQGWVSENTVIKPIDWVPTYSVVQPYRSRFEISYSVTPNYATKSLFAGGQILGADRDVRIETYDSPTYTLNLADPAAIRTLPPKLALAAAGLNRVVQTGGSPPSKAALEASLPPDFRLVDVVHQQGRVQQVILAEALPQQPDVLSVRSTRGSVRPKETYLLTSSVSAATAGELRGAGMDYPTWALVKYTQLPASVPQRVRDLATRLTAQSSTPYDKAKAIEAYLKTLTYSLEIEPPPYRADGVDHFLFTSRRGYSEYFASSMTVLLRASGVPARLAVGYTVGDKVPDHDIYIVADSHSHAWVEVFFPRYGWVPFEPTPGKSLPAAVPPVSGSASSSTGEEGNLDEFGDEDEDLEFPFLGVAAPPPLSLIDRLRQALPWALVALVVVTMAVGAGWLLWQRYMVPSTNPEVAFRHLALLGALGSVGLMPHQTPFQYREQLSQALPSHGNQLSVIVDAYVRHLYGRKEMADQDRDRLAQAWLEVRGPLLLRVLRRRNP